MVDPLIKDISESVTWILYVQPATFSLLAATIALIYKGVIASKNEQIADLKSKNANLKDRIVELGNNQPDLLLKKYNDFVKDRDNCQAISDFEKQKKLVAELDN